MVSIIRKEAFVACFKILPFYLPGHTRKPTKSPSRSRFKPRGFEVKAQSLLDSLLI
jgi:hypothetical protein